MNRIKPEGSRNLTLRDGRWYVDFQFQGKRIRHFAGYTKERARTLLHKLRTEKVDEALGFKKPEAIAPVDFAEFADEFLDLHAKRKRSYDRDINSMDHLKKFFKGQTLQEIGPELVARYKAARFAEEPTPSPRTVNRELACLRTMLYKAVEWGKIATYPLQKKNLLEHEPEFTPRILTPAEALRLIQAADPRNLRPAIILWLNTGTRKNELLKAKWENIDLRKRLLTIPDLVSKSKRKREIPLSTDALETLEAMAKAKTGDFVFNNPAKKTHIRDLTSAFITAKARAKIPGRLRIHDLRHTFAAWQIQAGTDPKTLSEILGHSDVRITLNLYCHTTLEIKRAAVNRIPEILNPSRPKVAHQPVAVVTVPRVTVRKSDN